MRRWFGNLAFVALVLAMTPSIVLGPGLRPENSSPLTIYVSLEQRRLWVVTSDADTLRSARVAVGRGNVISYAGRTWRFKTPTGVRTVIAKDADPVWIPPDWFYIEVAQEYGLAVRSLPATGIVRLRDGTALTMRDNVAGVIGTDGVFRDLPTDEHLVFDGALFVPPLGSRNRRVKGELGRYRLDLGDGFYLHGTPHRSSVGRAATHGCLRLHDDDIEWLYEHVPVGTRVYIY